MLKVKKKRNEEGNQEIEKIYTKIIIQLQGKKGKKKTKIIIFKKNKIY